MWFGYATNHTYQGRWLQFKSMTYRFQNSWSWNSTLFLQLNHFYICCNLLKGLNSSLYNTEMLLNNWWDTKPHNNSMRYFFIIYINDVLCLNLVVPVLRWMDQMFLNNVELIPYVVKMVFIHFKNLFHSLIFFAQFFGFTDFCWFYRFTIKS